MARITVMVNASGEPNDEDVVNVDVPLTLTVAELKAVLEGETSHAVSTMNLFFEGHSLPDGTVSLESLNIKDGEMLGLMINIQRPSTRSQHANPPPNPNDPEKIEAARLRVLADPAQLSAVLREVPELAQAINSPEEFRRVWLAIAEARERRRRQQEAQRRMENEDPFNPQLQAEILEKSRLEIIQKNLQYAYDNNPAAFVQVSMLYIPVLVNGHYVKAFVDSGAQSTIMSPTCAEACGISHLIDDRYSGVARGVGTARIIGKVHQAKMQVGDAELDCAFTVMEGKDVDLLFGLDMLRRHQGQIDLLNNVLRFGTTEIPFLGDADIPKREEEKMLDEPTVAGPDGTEIGARSGTVRPAGTAKAAHEALVESQSSGKQPVAQASPSLVPVTTRGQASSSASIPDRAAAPPASSIVGATSSYKVSEDAISQLEALGFSRKEAINALEATDGNVEYAAGLLFR